MKDSLRLYTYPDPVLFYTTKEIDVIDASIQKLGEDLLLMAIETNAIGVAAPQIGVSLKAAVIREPQEKQEITHFILNPTIIEKSIEMVDSLEGCLSFPGLNIPIKRHSTVTVEFKTIKNEVVKKTFTGLLSIAFQHEIDHLNNILLIDRMSNTQKKRYKNYFKQLKDLSIRAKKLQAKG